MVQAAIYGAAQDASVRMAAVPPPRTRRRKVMAASIVVAIVCMCVAVVTFGINSSAVESEELLSKYAVKPAAPPPLGKVELAVLKIKTRANDKVTQLSSKLKDTDEILARKEEMLDMETRRLKLAQKRLDDIKAQQKEMKRKRDSLKDAKNKFEKQESEATNRAANLKSKISDSRDSLKDTKDDIDKREHRLSKLRRAVEDASTQFAVADSKKMHLSARLQQDEDEMQALKDKATQLKHVLAAGAVSGAQNLALMADKAKTRLQHAEAVVSAERGSEHAMIERLRHLENERLELIRKAADMQSKAVRYKMLAAKADDSAADAAHLLHKDVLNLQQQAGMAPQRSFGTREESTRIDRVSRLHLVSSPRRGRLQHQAARSALVDASAYRTPGDRFRGRHEPHIYKQRHARSDGNIFQAIDAPNDGIAYAARAAATVGRSVSARDSRLSSRLRSVGGGVSHESARDAGNPLSGDYGASD